MCVLAVRLLTHSIELCPSAFAPGNIQKLSGRPSRVKEVSSPDAGKINLKVNAVSCLATFRLLNCAPQLPRAEYVSNFEGKA
jgi:hypothetical protein